MTFAIEIDGLGKCYRLGETHANNLGEQLVRLGRRLAGRASAPAPVAEDFWALRDVRLSIREGEAVGIIGGNGAGKSTLLKILSRITQPTVGHAAVRGRLASLLEVGTGFHPELSGRENVFLNGTILGMRRAEVAAKLDEIVSFAGVERFIDTPVKRYSSGMYVRLAFAVAAHLEPDVLVIDEVLAVGDAEFQTRCLGKMNEVANEGRTVLFVSHNMAAVNKLCSRAVLLEEGRVKLDGSVLECLDAYLRKGTGENVGVFEPHSDDTRFAVRSISLKDEAGQVTTDFRVDQALYVHIEYENMDPIPGLEFGLRVESSQGVPVFSSQRPGEMIGRLPGGGATCVARIPGSFLAPGNFSLTFGVHVPGVMVHSILDCALRFTIHETGSALARYSKQDTGVVLANCDWIDVP